jgi:hypothetical protein
MTITNPLAWGLLLLAIPIILFFFLQVRFRKELITTTIFWQQVFEERRNRRLRRRFRHFLSLFLALLFLTVLTAAVLDPVLSVPQNNRCVIIIDNSAGMNALLPDSQTTRLDAAKRQAAKRLDKTAGQQTAILTANVNPKIVSGFTDHTGTLRRKLAEIPATDFPADLSAAFHLAEQLIADQSDLPVYIYTGTNLPETILLKPNVHVVHVGLPIDNLAITRFQPRRLPGQAADYEIFVEVMNFGTEAVQTRLEIDCNGEIVDVIPLALEPNEPVTKIVRSTSAGGGLFRAALASTDLFPVDDTVTAFLSEQFVQRILLYGTENFFLRHVLQAQPQTEIILAETIPDSLPPDSVLVLHQIVPETLPPGNVLIIDPHNDCNLFRVEQRLERPIAAKIDPESSLVRFIQPGLVFTGAKNIVPQRSNFQVLMETADDFPLYVQFVSENQRTLVLSADLNQGDFSLRTAFPILISQALTSFRNSEELQKAYSTAEPVKLTLQTEQTQVVLRSPSGREEIFPCQSGSVSFGKLGECGVWTILEPASGRELTQIACNLLSTAESNLRASAVPAQSEMETGTLFVRPIWHSLALLALLFTAAEWFLYQRRWVE